MLHTGDAVDRSAETGMDEATVGIAAVFKRFISPIGDEPVDALGIPFRIHYMALALFAFFVAGVPLVFSLFPQGAEIRQLSGYAVCATGVALAPAILYLGKRGKHEFNGWLFQAVLLFSIVGPFICQATFDELQPVVLTIYMLGPIGAAFYFPLKRALPLIVFGAATIVYASTMIDEPDALLRGLVVAVITVSCAGMLSAMKLHLTRAIQSNREISERDALTGAHNMRKFDERLTYEIARSQRGGGAFALIEFDLDRFKSVNDMFNHSVGDDVLVATAEAIQGVLTPADLLVRRGGDEFVVVAPYMRGRDHQALIDRAQQRIVRARHALCPDLPPTASVGWVVHELGETAQSTLRRADDALKSAKQFAHVREAEADAGLGVGRSSDSVSSPGQSKPRGNVLEIHRNPIHATPIGDDPISGVMQIAWRTAAIATILISVAVLTMAALKQTSFEFSTPEFALMATWLFVMTPISLWVSTRSDQPAATAHVLSASALFLITLSCVTIGDAAPVAVEMYLLSNVVFVALLPPKPAFAYVAIGFGLYGYFLYSSDYPIADMRLTITAVNFAIVAALLSINRQRTLEAASEKAQLARTDALTGLPNMRRLRDRINFEIRRCQATGGSLALLMLDLDEFKTVNDEKGHTKGDEVLVAVADALEQVARHADMPARRGGDEFAVVLTDAEANDAQVTAGRVADAIRQARLKVVADINPNASVGWVVWKPGESLESLINRADGALNRAKLTARHERHNVSELV